MRVRPFEMLDYEQTLMLARMMHEESTFSIHPFNEQAVQQLADACVSNPDMVALLAERDGEIVGFIVGFALEHFFSDARFASDLALYVHPAHRGSTAAIRLMANFEAWSRSRNCVELRMGAATGITPEKTDRFYQGLGYSITGTQYVKPISPLSGPH